MAVKFDGDVIVITGGAGGLGSAYARLLSSLGARIVVNDTGGVVDGRGGDPEAAARLVAELTAAGGEAVADVHDGSTVEGATAVIDTAISAFGRVDAVIANAGILRDRTFHQVTDEDFFAVIDAHFVGTVRMFRAAYPHMREQGYGRLVSTTSAAGLFGNFGQTSYAAAKMGIVGLTRSLALEGAKFDVKANVAAPVAATRMTNDILGPLAGQVGPERVAPVVAYLCHRSLEASGQILSIGGGRFGRVAVGAAPGVQSDTLDVDFVAEHIDEVLAADDFIFPRQAAEEIQLTLSLG